MRERTAKELIQLAILTAISIVLVYLVRFPIFPSAPFLEYDMADVPILIGTFLFGPVSGILLTVAVSILQGLTVSAQSGWIGIIMHIVATGTFVIVAGVIYRLEHTRKGAVLALICGSIAMTLMMIPLNLIFTVYFMGVERAVVVAMLPKVIVPFNLIKASGNSIITFLVYKQVGRALRLETDNSRKM